MTENNLGNEIKVEVNKELDMIEINEDINLVKVEEEEIKKEEVEEEEKVDELFLKELLKEESVDEKIKKFQDLFIKQELLNHQLKKNILYLFDENDKVIFLL
jgi:hypothetical protein